MSNNLNTVNNQMAQEAKYHITDSISKGLLIDAPVTIITLSLPIIAPAFAAVLVPAIPVMSATTIAGLTALEFVTASGAYYHRSIALENGHGLWSYAESGALKYGIRGIIKMVINGELNPINIAINTASNVAFGIYNHVGYGIDGNNTGMEVPVIVEASESTIKAYLTDFFTIEEAKAFNYNPIDIGAEFHTGFAAGMLLWAAGTFLYDKSIGHIHQGVDAIYSFPELLDNLGSIDYGDEF